MPARSCVAAAWCRPGSAGACRDSAGAGPPSPGLAPSPRSPARLRRPRVVGCCGDEVGRRGLCGLGWLGPCAQGGQGGREGRVGRAGGAAGRRCAPSAVRPPWWIDSAPDVSSLPWRCCSSRSSLASLRTSRRARSTAPASHCAAASRMKARKGASSGRPSIHMLLLRPSCTSRNASSGSVIAGSREQRVAERRKEVWGDNATNNIVIIQQQNILYKKHSLQHTSK